MKNSVVLLVLVARYSMLPSQGQGWRSRPSDSQHHGALEHCLVASVCSWGFSWSFEEVQSLGVWSFHSHRRGSVDTAQSQVFVKVVKQEKATRMSSMRGQSKTIGSADKATLPNSWGSSFTCSWLEGEGPTNEVLR